MTREKDVSMSDRVEELREEIIPPRREQAEEILTEAEEQYEEPWMIPEELEQRYSNLQETVNALEGEANTLEHYAEQWGDDTFRIRELSVGSVAKIQDDVAEASNVDFRGGGTPKSGFARTRSLEVAVVSKPSEAPDVSDLPDAIGDWLYDRIDSFNTMGDVELGNTSLRANLMEKRATEMSSES